MEVLQLLGQSDYNCAVTRMNNKQADTMNTLAVKFLCSASDMGAKTKMEKHSVMQSKWPQ